MVSTHAGCGSNAGSGGDHRTRLRQTLLIRMFDDNVMELLLVIAQHAHAVSTNSFVNPDAHPACKWTGSPASITSMHDILQASTSHCIYRDCTYSDLWKRNHIPAGMHSICNTIKVCYRCALGQQSVALGYLSGHLLLQKPFRTEAPLLMEIFQQVFKGTTAAELAEATAPVVAQRQPGQSRRANIVRPKGDA